MRTGAATVLGVALASATCFGGPSARTAPTPASNVFSYDATAPLDLIEAGREEVGGITIRDISFLSPVEGRVPAHLYEPVTSGGRAGRAGPGPALLIMHGIPGNRSTWRGLALAYARLGVRVMTVTGPFVRTDLAHREPRLIPSPLLTVWDSAEVVQAVVDLRRAVDILERDPRVDPDRIGFVGHSFGAYLGGLLAATEPRISSFALMAPSTGWATWMRTHLESLLSIDFRELSPEEQARWYRSVEPLELTSWLHAVEGDRLLVHIALRDRAVMPADTERLLGALPEDAMVRRYDLPHALGPEAYRDQAVFLGRALGFAGADFEPPDPPGGGG